MRIDEKYMKQFDWILLLFFLVVTGLGLINLFSSSGAGLDSLPPVFLKQVQFILLGLVIMVLCISVDYRVLSNASYVFYIVTLLLLCAALVLGKTVAGTQRWIDLGFFRLQPSEPAKLSLVFILAHFFAKKETKTGLGLREMVQPICITGVPFVLIILQPDLGTALMLGIIFVSMLLFVEVRLATVLSLGAFAVSLGFVYLKFLAKPYQLQRIATLFSPAVDKAGSSYHITQAKIAIGSGGFFGKGYMKGTQSHLNFLPERHTDFAFAVWAEEWGFVGCLILLTCYLLFILLGLRVAFSARDRFGMYLAIGITAVIFWQAVINILMVIGLLPVVGIPLPLVSYGGSSLLVTIFSVAILLNIRMRRFVGNR